jgi:hypothetical protein
MDAARTSSEITLITAMFAAVHESAFGTKRTNGEICCLSAFGGKADIRYGASLRSNGYAAATLAPPKERLIGRSSRML